MSEAEKRILEWAKAGETLELPAWDRLPSIPLYMDQVIFYLRDSLRFYEQEEEAGLLTSSMINNYVKNGVLPHPEKKKYTREHLGALLAICMLKQVLPIQEVKALLEGPEQEQALYELFRTAHTEALGETCRTLAESCRKGEDLRLEALRLAVKANAQRAAAERILQELKTEK